jgi:hypothetical protein
MTLPLLGAKSCRSCEHHFKLPSSLIVCKRYPPQLVFVAVPGPMGEPQWITNSFFPPVNPDIPCGEYKRNELFAAEELQVAQHGRMSAQ